MRLTPKHVGMEIQSTLWPEAPWEILERVSSCGCKGLEKHSVIRGGSYDYFSSDNDWRVRKPQKKGKGRN